MAEMRLFLDDEEGARAYIAEARALRDHIDERFWQDDLQYYALALDGDKRPVRSIASNAGHLLAAGAARSAHARAIADRLLSPELFNGFGGRTLSIEHPSYNPIGYHLGAVWPVEAATFIFGFRRYGLDEHALTLANALLDASAAFVGGRLPEVFAGQQRSEDSPEPFLYPSACWPQAWSASAVILTLQALLGIYPFAPARMLMVIHPILPRGIEEIVVERLRVGDAEVSLHFWRRASNEVRHEVTGRHGDLVVVNAPPPVDLEGRHGWKRWLLRHAPGKTAQILRLAMGEI
jgi:glycogen debranching enzyme